MIVNPIAFNCLLFRCPKGNLIQMNGEHNLGNKLASLETKRSRDKICTLPGMKCNTVEYLYNGHTYGGHPHIDWQN